MSAAQDWKTANSPARFDGEHPVACRAKRALQILSEIPEAVTDEDDIAVALYEAGFQAGAAFYLDDAPDLTAKLAAAEQKLMEAQAIERFLKGEPLNYSTGQCDSLTCGYGKLDENGYWEFPLPERVVTALDQYVAQREAAMRERYEVLHKAPEEVSAAHEAEAVASMAYENARDNFSDSRIESQLYENAMVRASTAEATLRNILFAPQATATEWPEPKVFITAGMKFGEE